MGLKKRVKIPLMMVAVLTLIVLFAYFSVQPRKWDDIERSKVLNVVTEYSALGYVVDGDSVSGFEYEVLKRFADSLGFELNIVVEPDLEKNIEGLNRGDYDMIMKLLPTTLELKSAVKFSQPLIKNYLVLVQRTPTADDESTLVRHVADLENRTLTMPEHTPDELVLRNIEDELGIALDIDYLPNIDIEHVLAMVARGDVDMAAADIFTARAVKRFYPQLDIDTKLGFTQPCAWAFPKKSEQLCQTFDAWLDNFKQSDDFVKLYRKYYR
ncbi:MAG: transporter substrate-binding domain-containing protein [Paludibacteraceae bacterium]